MITFLAKLWIKDYQKTDLPEVRQAYGVLCGGVGIGFNILLFLGKFLAGLLSNSIAITADAFNNLSDAGSSVVTLIGFQLAGQRPDLEHPFGHGRIEYLSGLAVSAAILIMAVELIQSSFSKILHPEAVNFQPLTAVILAASIGVKLYMAYYNRSTGNRIQSAAMKATATDSLSDALATSVVFIASIIGRFTSLNIDGWCGLIVGFFILYAGFSAAKDTLNPLLGQAPDPEFIQSIRQITLAHPEILSIHDLLVHDYGPGRKIISLHCEVPASGNILELHDAIDNIERELSEKLHCEAVIHMDPVEVHDARVLAIKEKLGRVLHALDDRLTFHDFRVVFGKEQINLIFDLVVPFTYNEEEELKLSQQVMALMQEVDARYQCVITMDRSFVAEGE